MERQDLTYRMPPLQHSIWGSIFAGVVVVFVVQITLGLLGAAIGLNTINPAQEDTSLKALGVGSMIWWVVSGLIALFIGGWVSGRLAGFVDQMEATLHGILTWGVTTLLMMFFVTTTLGAIVGGAFGLLKSGFSAAGQAAGAAASEGIESAQRTTGGANPISAVAQEGQEMLRQTGDPALQPESLEARAEQVGATAEQAATSPNPNAAAPQVGQEAQAQVQQVAQNVDRQDVANVVAARTDMTPDEARQAVDNVANTVTAAGQAVQNQLPEIQAQAEEVVEESADVGATAAFWGFIMMLFGALAAGVGGATAITGNLKRRNLYYIDYDEYEEYVMTHPPRETVTRSERK